MEKFSLGSLGVPKASSVNMFFVTFVILLTPLSLHSSFILQNIFKAQISLKEMSPIKFYLTLDVFSSF